MSKNKSEQQAQQKQQELERSTAVDEQALDESLQGAQHGTLDQQSTGVEQDAKDVPVSLESRLAESEREVLRVRAEMENFRKRMQRDSDQQLKYANVPLVRDLIEVVDNLTRALDAANQENSTSAQAAAPPQSAALRDGVQMVLKQLAGVLSKYGCKRIETVGHEFDPNVHEAISQMPSQEYAAGTVMQEFAAGYSLHDRVIRPSSVIVSTGAPQ